MNVAMSDCLLLNWRGFNTLAFPGLGICKEEPIMVQAFSYKKDNDGNSNI
jgi:hypothetical protein